MPAYVVDRLMINIVESTRLLIGLVVLVYAILVVLSEASVSRRVILAGVGLVPFPVWMIAPGQLAIGSLELPLEIRRYALLVGGAAVAFRYAALRMRARSRGTRAGLAAAAAILMLAAVALGSANWLVAAATVITAIATAAIIPSEASSGEDR
ncbi:MAG: hypothetical protein ACOCY8_03370 [Spirochaetota bacterium]